MAHLIIGSRGARLALSQCNGIKTKLERLHPGLLVGIELLEDVAQPEAFQAAATEALFTRQVDAVLHDLRELPAVLAPDFHLAAINERAEAREALLVRADWRARVSSLVELPDEARIGINSALRRAQLLAHGRDWELHELYAPLEIRLKQLDAGEVDALLVAAAALAELGETQRRAALLEPTEILPLAGQGALALQTRLEDQRTNLLLEALNHWPTRYASEAERALLRNLPDAHYYPTTALAELTNEANGYEPQLLLTALVADPTGRRVVRQSRRGPLRQSELLGSELALEMLQNGARELLQLPSNGHDLVAELFPAAHEPRPHINGAPELLKSRAAVEPALASLSLAAWAPVAALPQPAVSVFVKDSAQEFDLVAAKTRRAREQKPLYDQRLLIARAAHYNAELVKALETLGAAVSVCPTARLSALENWAAFDRALLHLSWYEWLTFVSAPSVGYFLKHFAELGHHRTEIESRRICAVGAQTVTALRAADIQCDLLLEDFTAERLAEAVLRRYGVRERLRGATMLLFASQTLGEELRLALNKLGVYMETVAAYRLALPESGGAEAVAALRETAFNYAIFNGASSVENLAAVIEPHPLPIFLQEARVLCSNDEARDAAQAHGLAVQLQPKESSVGEVVRALREDCLDRYFAQHESDSR